MNALTIARMGEVGIASTEPVTATAGQYAGTAGPAISPDRILAFTATATLYELARPAILCTRLLCVQRGETRLEETDGNASWWCLTHGADELAIIAVDECRVVRDAVRASRAVAA